jgi:hypothetical protein
MRGLAIALVSLTFLGCDFDDAFQRYCDKNPKCAPDAGVQPPIDTSVQPPIDTSVASPDVPKAGPDGGDVSRFGDGGPGPGGPPPPPIYCDVNLGPGSCGADWPGYICSLGGFCLKTCASSADCRATQPYNPKCVPFPPLQGVNVCACAGNSCALKDSTLVCSDSDFICMRRCYADSDCRGGPSFAARRICNLTTQVCSINWCAVDEDCKNINPALRCDQASMTCVP